MNVQKYFSEFTLNIHLRNILVVHGMLSPMKSNEEVQIYSQLGIVTGNQWVSRLSMISYLIYIFKSQLLHDGVHLKMQEAAPFFSKFLPLN